MLDYFMYVDHGVHDGVIFGGKWLHFNGPGTDCPVRRAFVIQFPESRAGGITPQFGRARGFDWILA